ncbi:MAG: hypothetical protein Q4B90_03175 [Eubacteriales bacterium]|nr:hypothetical protein [Eubacteriales bacterium]
MEKKSLSYEKKKQLNQVAATMAVENMLLTKASYQNLYSIASGEKTVEQIIDEITAKYKREV